jgi:hypothetical protein
MMIQKEKYLNVNFIKKNISVWYQCIILVGDLEKESFFSLVDNKSYLWNKYF